MDIELPCILMSFKFTFTPVTTVSPEGSIQVDPTTINGNDSGNATFNCMALGGPGNMFSWTKVRDNAVVVNDSELMLVDIMASDGGVYQCSVENLAGSDNDTVILNGKPKLTHTTSLNWHYCYTISIPPCSFSSSDRTASRSECDKL